MLLAAVGKIGKQGPPMVAFFGLMYYSALRPEDVANVKRSNLTLAPPQLNKETGETE
jgi:hypothetical protein